MPGVATPREVASAQSASGSPREWAAPPTAESRLRQQGGGTWGNQGFPHDLVAQQSYLLAALAGEEVVAVHEAHPVAARAHDQRVRSCAVGQKPNAAEQVAVRDAGRSEDRLAR